MIAVAPNRLAPGFPRTWPDCQPAMAAIARHLLALGAEDEEVIICLMMDFPAPAVAPGPPWRSDVYYANVVACEKMGLLRQPDLAERIRNEPSGYDLQVVTTAAELIRLCVSHGITFTHDAQSGELVLSRKVLVGGPVHTLIKRYKAEIIRMAAT